MGNVLSASGAPFGASAVPAQYIPQPDHPSVKKQSVVVKGTGTWGSGIHRSPLCADGKLIGVEDPMLATVYDNFRMGLAKNPHGPCLGWRPMDGDVAGDYQFITYMEVGLWATDVGSALRELGKKRGDIMGLYARNCVEWVVAEQACNAYSHPTVAIYDTFGSEAVRYIINHSEMTVIFVEKPRINALYAAIEAGAPNLQHVVCFGDCTDEDVQRYANHEVTLMSMDSLRKLGQAHRHKHDPPKCEDIATIMYTSGTTGMPKGVVLTNLNMVSTANSALTNLKIRSDDVFLSFLPLAHSFERITEYAVLQCGGSIGFYQGDIRQLMSDMKALRPTLMIGVPRVYNRIYEKTLQAIQSGNLLTQQLYQRGYAYRKGAMASGLDTPWFNTLLFDKLKAVMGGRLRIVVSGSAPLDTRVQEWMRVCMCSVFVQGYGLTETCAATTLQSDNDLALGTVGIPLPANEFKLVDVEEMEYRTTDNPPRGELLIRGNSVFSGYYKDPEMTKADKDEDGWFHTGDIGQWNEDGSLSIVDRKKNIFKLAQGEYIAVEMVETAYQHCGFVAQLFVYGDSLKPFLVAVVVPDEEKTREWAGEQGIDGDFAAVCKHPKLRAMLEAEMDKEAKFAKLKGFEKIKGILVIDQPFTVEDNLLTPTFKLKRPVAAKRFKKQLDELYVEVEAKMKK